MKHSFLLFLLTLIAFRNEDVVGCSMYKITSNAKTMVGCNHDTWFSTPRIWFEPAKHSGEIGAGFTGARPVAGNKFAPQSGMNEHGIVFSRLAAYYPRQKNPFSKRIKIKNEVDYLTSILHRCKTLHEVKRFIEKYDHSFFLEDVFIYIDPAGNYLIVEPYKIIEGSDPTYVLSNFCPSITGNNEARRLDRYRNGEDFIKTNIPSTSMSYCKALSDTMHVCRDRNGDGTLLTSIWDTKKGSVHLYFYHKYKFSVSFDLSDELEKGSHMLDVSHVFPQNPEFERLKNYLTPFNTPWMRIALVGLAGFLLMVVFLIVGVKILNPKIALMLKHVVLISVLNVSLIAYLFVLATNQNIFYFDAPYIHHSSNLISGLSYIPFLLIASIIPVTWLNIKSLKSAGIPRLTKLTLTFNNLIYLILLVGFTYWGLYSIWN
jgi:hypothetical protein